MEALKIQGMSEFAATGYCFGGMFLIPDNEECFTAAYG
jgi:hypothetical protein